MAAYEPTTPAYRLGKHPRRTDHPAVLADASPAMTQLKAIATASGDALYLCNGPVNPDYALLDLCADALHYAIAANKAYGARISPCRLDPDSLIRTPRDDERIAAWRVQDKTLLDEYYANTNEVTQRLRRAKKMKATTPAGIYAKALLVRVSKTGATELAMSLAADLVECKPLRAMLCPAEGEG